MGRVSPLRLPTRRLLLRPFRIGDVTALAAIRGRPEVVRHLYGDTLDRSGAETWVRRAMTQDRLTAPGDDLSLAVTLQDRVIGDVLLRWAPGVHAQGEIGFVFHPDVSGHGYAAEAAAAVVELGFAAVGLHRVVGRCDARNHASASVLRRLGMRQEAHLVENEWVKGEWCDEAVFAVLEDEWRALTSGAAQT